MNNIKDTYTHAPSRNLKCMAIISQVCFHRWLFCWPCKTELVHYRACWPTGCINQNWLGTKLLPMAVSIYLVVCVHPCRLLRAQRHCLWPNGREGPPSVCHLPPPPPHSPPTHLFIRAIRDITRVVKNYLKNQQWILHAELAMKHYSYKSALLIHEILCGCM